MTMVFYALTPNKRKPLTRLIFVENYFTDVLKHYGLLNKFNQQIDILKANPSALFTALD